MDDEANVRRKLPMSKDEFVVCVREMFDSALDPTSSVIVPFSSEDCEIMLDIRQPTSIEDDLEFVCRVEDHDWSCVGFPNSGSFCEIVGHRLFEWLSTGVFPLSLATVDGYGESVNHDRLNNVYDSCDSLFGIVVSQWKKNGGSNVAMMVNLFKRLTVRGVMTLLGITCTHGSKDHLPPRVYHLVRSFHSLYVKDGKKTRLTVGAKALTKHAHRSDEGFWGSWHGSDSHKNSEALRRLWEIVSNCVWINVHGLPHEVHVIELRNQQGYGARWTCTYEPEFRGFLEPFDPNGHDKGWRH